MQFNKAKVRYSSDIIKPSRKEGRVSVYTEDFKGEYYNLPVENLHPFKNQARRTFNDNDIEALAATIKAHGIRQPLTVLPSEVEEGHFEVVSGERRLRAAKLLGKEYVPCIIIHDRLKAEEISIIENVQRKNLHPVELMRAYQGLLDNKICTSTLYIAQKVGVIRSAVIDVLNLKRLSPEIQNVLLEKNIRNRDFLRKLCKIVDADLCHSTIENFLKKKNGSVIKNSDGAAISKKYSVISIMLEDDNFRIVKNQIARLTDVQRLHLEQLLKEITAAS
jgi:ParB family transcriptional regulator, chromosome partitioning protein